MSHDFEFAEDVTSGQLAIRDFDRLSPLIHRLVGIKMPPNKRTMVEGRLRRRLAATGAETFSDYCDALFENGDDGPEVVHFIDAITTNKTDFFREPEHFRLLTQTILPALPKTQRKLKMWSAACSTGAEPYTMAMVAGEFIQGRPEMDVSITATDICTTVLATAFNGIYTTDTVAPVPDSLRQRYVLKSKDQTSNVVRMAPSLRSKIRFGRLNLMAASYDLDRDFDVIFCRNVLIYFDRKDQGAVLRRLVDHLRPGGILTVGHSETLHGFDLPVEPIGHTMFRRR